MASCPAPALSVDQAPIVLRSCFDCRPVHVAAMVGAFFCSVAWEIYNSWHCAAACGMQQHHHHHSSPPVHARWVLGFAFLHSFLTLFLSIRRLSFVVSCCCCSCSNGKLMTFCTSLCDFGGSLTLWSEALSCIWAESRVSPHSYSLQLAVCGLAASWCAVSLPWCPLTSNWSCTWSKMTEKCYHCLNSSQFKAFERELTLWRLFTISFLNMYCQQIILSWSWMYFMNQSNVHQVII